MTKKKKIHKPHPETVKKNTVVELAHRYPGIFMFVSTVALLFLLYYPALLSPTLILNEESVLTLPLLSHAKNLPHIFSEDFLLFTEGQFRPLSYAILSVVRTVVSAEAVLFWHLWLLGFHVLNSMLLYAILCMFTQKKSARFLGVLAFALHPVGTVIVNDINQYYILLGITFSLSAMLSYLVFGRRHRRGYYGLSLLLYFLALCTARQGLAVIFFVLLVDGLYEKRRGFVVLFRGLPFVALPILFSPWLFMASPHPLHFNYIAMHANSFWHGFFTVVGASWIYIQGVVFGLHLPAALHEIVRQLFTWMNFSFAGWFLLHAAALCLMVFGLIRRRWICVGLLLLYGSMVPYLSVYFNRVVDYISWTYFYFAVAGLGILLSGLYDDVTQRPRRKLRMGLQVLLVLVVIGWGVRTYDLNRYVQNPIAYWSHITDQRGVDVTSLRKIGEAYLVKGEEDYALHNLFTPFQKEIRDSCLIMSRYYCRNQENLAAMIHLRYASSVQKTGVVLEKHCLVTAEFMLAVGALDHAEENLGKVLMVNPYHTGAMSMLARVWLYKGFIREAHRMLEQARQISPGDRNAAITEKLMVDVGKRLQQNAQPVSISPPDPDWLAYALDQTRSPEMRKQIIALSDRTNLNDPVIQLEAVISLLEEERYEEAAKKIKPIQVSMSNFSFACAIVSMVLAQTGQVDEAIQYGLHAATLDTKNMMAWRSLAVAYANKGEEEMDAGFVSAMASNPSLAAMFYHNLGKQREQSQRRDAALQYYEKALQAMPYDLQLYKDYANCLLQAKKSEKVIALIQDALKVKKDDAEIHAILGFANMAQNKHQDGIRAFRTAIEIDPENAFTHFYLGFALKEENRLEEAIVELERSVLLKPDHLQALVPLAACYYHTKDYPKAIATYRKVKQLDPAHPLVHVNLGSIYMEQREYDKAIVEFEDSIRLRPTFAPAYQRLHKIYTLLGDEAKARSVRVRARKEGLSLD